MEPFQMLPLSASHVHDVFSRPASSSASSLDNIGSPYSERSSVCAAHFSPSSSPPQTPSPRLLSPGTWCKPLGSCSSERDARTQASPDSSVNAFNSRNERLYTERVQRPPFYLIPATPETADAILVIPGPNSSFSLGTAPWLAAPPTYAPSSRTYTPTSPLLASSTPSISDYAYDSRPCESNMANGNEGGTGRAFQDRCHTCTKASVHRRPQRYQQRGLLFVGSAMSNAHAMRRARRISRGTRMRAYRIVWNMDPQVMFDEATKVPVAMISLLGHGDFQ